MINLAFLEYSFVVDTDAYQHYSDFEKSLADFFNEKGLVARVINGANTSNQKKVIYIEKKADVLESAPEVKLPQEVMKNIDTKVTNQRKMWKVRSAKKK